jgi:predicted acetyltransferase
MEVSLAKLEHLKPYEDFLVECYQSGLSKYKEAISEPRVYLERTVSDQGNTSTYFCVEHEEILGAIRFRHHTSEYIENVIGHVGYETKPTARGKGVARIMLSWIQSNILDSDAIVTCEADNIASEKVIKRCGGIYLNQIYSVEKQNDVKRFKLPST